VPGCFRVLGTDGYGRSYTRDKLREFFEVSRDYVVLAALDALLDEGAIEVSRVKEAMTELGIPAEKADPFTV